MIKINIKILATAILASILFTACATWKETSGMQVIKSQKLSLNLKENKWQALNNESAEHYNLTKDGVALQHINIQRFDLDEALNNSKRAIEKDILPHELSELIIENLKLQNNMQAFKVLSNNPEIIAKQNGINIISQMKDEYNNLIKINSTYFIYDNKLYSINYTAPNQHYYNKDLNQYIEIKNSMKLSL